MCGKQVVQRNKTNRNGLVYTVRLTLVPLEGVGNYTSDTTGLPLGGEQTGLAWLW